MPRSEKHSVCPLENAHALERGWRMLIHNPVRLLSPYIHEGMIALDMGCGPGFFTVPLARMVGPAGRVIAADVQQGMLDKVEAKIRGTGLERRVELRLTSQDALSITQPLDFVLAFYLLHELPDQQKFLHEIKSLLKPDGRVFIAEPNGHVTKEEFAQSMEIVKRAGYAIIARPRIWFSRAIVARST